MDREEGVNGLRIYRRQIRWGGALKPMSVEPSVCEDVGWLVAMVDLAMAGPGMVRRLRSCRDGQKPKGERATDCPLHYRLVLHTRKGDLGRTWASAAQNQPISQHTLSPRVAHTCTMQHKTYDGLK